MRKLRTIIATAALLAVATSAHADWRYHEDYHPHTAYHRQTVYEKCVHCRMHYTSYARAARFCAHLGR